MTLLIIPHRIYASWLHEPRAAGPTKILIVDRYEKEEIVLADESRVKKVSLEISQLN